jgi:hypothetical protein
LTIAILLGLELALPPGGHWPPGTSAAFGLLGSAAIVGLGKGLIRLGLQRPESTDE